MCGNLYTPHWNRWAITWHSFLPGHTVSSDHGRMYSNVVLSWSPVQNAISTTGDRDGIPHTLYRSSMWSSHIINYVATGFLNSPAWTTIFLWSEKSSCKSNSFSSYFLPRFHIGLYQRYLSHKLESTNNSLSRQMTIWEAEVRGTQQSGRVGVVGNTGPRLGLASMHNIAKRFANEHTTYCIAYYLVLHQELTESVN